MEKLKAGNFQLIKFEFSMDSTNYPKRNTLPLKSYQQIMTYLGEYMNQ